MTALAEQTAPAVTDRGVEGTRLRRRGPAWLGLAPFGVYVLLFLAVPAILAVTSGFADGEGRFTLGNFAALANPNILQGLWASIWISALTAVIGGIVGALICYALLGMKPDGAVRSVVDSASSVLAQFGGVMLAFAFIATIGANGLITTMLKEWGWVENPLNTFNGSGVMIYQIPGLVVVYLYFQIPLMVLTFLPALQGLKSTWAEANATLGGTRLQYWLRIGGPVLLPAFLGSLILLFANSFSSYATAAALVSQGGIVPLAIRQQLTSETVLGVSNVAGVLALVMVIVMVVLMTAYAALQRRTGRWQTGSRR
ncbi:ABC transporter permease subunit [Schumannella sp. 10F1B-5-1]|uniref:ABC transporter permease n=1 Tax=Schumannella sp. 10F1B-5-1 TaxID=2590780 RepID=UPI0015E82DFB|nr:ABC transporter permease [Schumannella sp. 10F1B-5-1]